MRLGHAPVHKIAYSVLTAWPGKTQDAREPVEQASSWHPHAGGRCKAGWGSSSCELLGRRDPTGLEGKGQREVMSRSVLEGLASVQGASRSVLGMVQGRAEVEGGKRPHKILSK